MTNIIDFEDNTILANSILNLDISPLVAIFFEKQNIESITRFPTSIRIEYRTGKRMSVAPDSDTFLLLDGMFQKVRGCISENIWTYIRNLYLDEMTIYSSIAYGTDVSFNRNKNHEDGPLIVWNLGGRCVDVLKNCFHYESSNYFINPNYWHSYTGGSPFLHVLWNTV
ncbi:hypothetical protein ACFC9N_10750 [Enterococcus casseliflavus]|uniref:hypothetical protein n=1 Tax=Enterococcus casseliflavus TaxID=37734 RepID=UPI0039A65868